MATIISVSGVVKKGSIPAEIAGFSAERETQFLRKKIINL